MSLRNVVFFTSIIIEQAVGLIVSFIRHIMNKLCFRSKYNLSSGINIIFFFFLTVSNDKSTIRFGDITLNVWKKVEKSTHE